MSEIAVEGFLGGQYCEVNFNFQGERHHSDKYASNVLI